MIRTTVLAAAAAALFALISPGPAQATIANPALSSAVPTAAEHVQYYYGPRRHRGYRSYRPHRSYGYYPRRHRHCWNQRVRVRVAGGYFVWRTHRRCGWR